MTKSIGIANARDGLSSYPLVRDIYTTQSTPRDFQVGLHPAENAARQRKTMLDSMRKSKLMQGIKQVLKIIMLIITFPLHLVFELAPRWIMNSIVRPTLNKIVKFATPPLKAIDRFIENRAQQIERFFVRQKMHVANISSACRNQIAVKSNEYIRKSLRRAKKTNVVSETSVSSPKKPGTFASAFIFLKVIPSCLAIVTREAFDEARQWFVK